MSAPLRHPLEADLDHVLASTAPALWKELQGARLFITGGTGFFGKWLLESWAWASRNGVLDAKATVLARNPAAFLAAFPHLANEPSIDFVQGDILDFELPRAAFTHILHAATPADTRLDREDPERMRSIIVDGTERVLALARSLPGSPRVLMTSSGAVYGTQPPELSHLPESYEPEPEAMPISAYGRGKRDAEARFFDAADRGMRCVIARCFAFAGPHLPLDLHYAFGNFIRDARNGGPIRVGGDGTPLRSYLYAGDLVAWLLTLLTTGTPGRAYNVGSDQVVSVGDLARMIARQYQCEVQIAQMPRQGIKAARYVPSIERAKRELGLRVTIDLDESIRRTERFLRAPAQLP